mmetsp:Transcript_16910/g.32073  ORF Transcript_16910/g.32073 Transcript_16910/m.32073 type:complete len:270 (-) Transcript_16910:757-1566(-)
MPRLHAINHIISIIARICSAVYVCVPLLLLLFLVGFESVGNETRSHRRDQLRDLFIVLAELLVPDAIRRLVGELDESDDTPGVVHHDGNQEDAERVVPGVAVEVDGGSRGRGVVGAVGLVLLLRVSVLDVHDAARLQGRVLRSSFTNGNAPVFLEDAGNQVLELGKLNLLASIRTIILPYPSEAHQDLVLVSIPSKLLKGRSEVFLFDGPVMVLVVAVEHYPELVGIGYFSRERPRPQVLAVLRHQPQVTPLRAENGASIPHEGVEQTP